jgi:hypothetical protein
MDPCNPFRLYEEGARPCHIDVASGRGCTLGHKPIPVQQGTEAPSHACTTTKTEEENTVPRFTVINYEQRTHGALAADDSWEYKKATSP